MPRCYFRLKLDGYQATLHVFTDASTAAYGLACYLRVVSPDGDIQVSFVMGKCRLAPIKPTTVPRLELLGAVQAVKVSTQLHREFRLTLQDPIFWTDSTIVLYYIENETARYPVFVANRVAIIRDGSRPDQWRWVDGASNPADDPSRGISVHDMVSNQYRWLRGPEFLYQSEENWPVRPDGPVPLSGLELAKPAKCLATISTPSFEILHLTDFAKLVLMFDTWYGLKRAVAWIIRFSRWLRNRSECPVGRLTVPEIRNAEIVILKYVQSSHYSPNSLSDSITQLSPVVNPAGLLVVGGRLRNAQIAESAKHPVILPGKCKVLSSETPFCVHIAELIVREVHAHKSAHSGREYVNAKVREEYWIVGARGVIRKVLAKCFMCKRLYGPMCVQKMADLPIDRVLSFTVPFEYCGIDVFGHFWVKRGRQTVKRWVCLFNDLVMRGVHLEALHSMDSDSFLNALIRVIARRGEIVKMRSDVGSNFVGAERELRDSINAMLTSKSVQDALTVRNIEWEFNPPKASNFSGPWERMIGIVRRALSSLMLGERLDDERFTTFLCTAEAIVNGRPITVVSCDPSDPKPLCPSDLMMGGKGTAPSMGTFDKSDQYGRRWRHVQFLTDQFWSRFTSDYLTLLQHRTKWLQPTKNLQVGDFVLIKDESCSRLDWPLGRVVEVFTSVDGLVRSVRVKTRVNTLVRPVNKICLLEAAN